MAEPVLKKGSTDPAVQDLQEALKILGHDPGPIDSVFGASTERAVDPFSSQRASLRMVWLPVRGSISMKPTRTTVLHLGSTGLPVRRLQSRMSAVGFDTGGVDGRFSPKTEAAVRQLQQRFDLAVGGVVGAKTWAVVAALENEGPAS